MKIRPIAKIHGGKARLSKFLLPLLPKNFEQKNFYDVFGGGGNFLLQCPRAKNETYNDLDPGLVNLMAVVVNHGEEIISKITKINYSEEQFLLHLNSKPENSVDKAVREIVIRRMSRGGLMKNFSKSNRLRGGRMGDENAWITWQEKELPKIVERFSGVKILNRNAIDILSEEKGEDNFFYCDPPYFPSTRTVPKVYNFEMTDLDHIKFLKACCEQKSNVMISGYDCPVYRKHFKNWEMVTITVPNSSSQTKSKEYRIECVWMNY